MLIFDQNDAAQNDENYQLEEDLGEGLEWDDGLGNDSDIDDNEDDEWIHF